MSWDPNDGLVSVLMSEFMLVEISWLSVYILEGDGLTEGCPLAAASPNCYAQCSLKSSLPFTPVALLWWILSSLAQLKNPGFPGLKYVALTAIPIAFHVHPCG